MTALVAVLSLLSFDDNRAQQATTIDVPPGAAYRVRSVMASADGRYCISLIENVRKRAARALSLACYEAGESTMLFTGSRVGAGGSYQIVVFRPTRDYAPAAVVIKTSFEKGSP